MSTGNASTPNSKVITRLILIVIAIATLSAIPASAQNAFQRDNPPIILALDGINGFLLQLLPDFLQRRTEPYLGNALSNSWGVDVCSFSATQTCSITTIPWSGLLGGTELDTYIIHTREVIQALAERHPERPLIIVAHSWGSVVAYQSLLDLVGELNSGAITSLITIGSPLETDSLLIRAAAPALNSISGGEFVLSNDLQKPPTVRHWTNFLIDEDPISGPKSGSDQNIRFAYPGLISLTSHNAYFEEPVLARQILLNLIDDCADLFTLDRSVPDGFGAAYNVLSPFQELTVQVSCESTTVTVSVGSGDANQYIYHKGYERTNDTWSEIVFRSVDGSVPISGGWFVGEAFQELTRTSTELAENNFVVAYVCTWEPSAGGSTGRWKCGCRNSACTQSFWQLQNFRRE